MIAAATNQIPAANVQPWDEEDSLPRPIRRLFDRPSRIVAWAIIIIAFVHPPHGTGVQLCWLKATTGIPCPGCGMTRSISCAAHGMPAESWSYHPFGLITLALFAAIAAMSLLPAPRRQGVLHALGRFPRTVHVLYVGFIASFIAYGAMRAINWVIMEGTW